MGPSITTCLQNLWPYFSYMQNTWPYVLDRNYGISMCFFHDSHFRDTCRPTELDNYQFPYKQIEDKSRFNKPIIGHASELIKSKEERKLGIINKIRKR